MRLEHEPRMIELRLSLALDRRLAAEAERNLAGVDRQQAVQPEIAHQFEISRTHPRQHQAPTARPLLQLERDPRQHPEKGAVHARALLKIQDESHLPLPQHLRHKIPQARAVLEARAPGDAHHHGIGVGIHHVNGLGSGLRHRLFANNY